MRDWKKRPRILSAEDERKLWSQFNTRYRTPLRDLCLFRIMLDAGLRVSEAVSLKPDHVDLQSQRVTVRDGKNGKDRTSYISSATRDLIAKWMEHRAGTDWLFDTSTGKQVDRTNLWTRLRTAAEKSGLSEADRIHPHVLRHTAATRLLERTGNVETVRRYLGHSDLSTTQIYVHLTDEDRFAADVINALEAA